MSALRTMARNTYVVIRNTARVIVDSERSQDILEAEEIVCRPFFRRLARRLEHSVDGRWLLTHRPELSKADIDLPALRQLPTGSLGRAYAEHLDSHGLDPDLLFVPSPRPDEPVSDYLMRRYRGAHDIWHTLLGLGTEGYEEVLVHAFGLGHLGLPVSQMICLFGIPKHMVLERRYEVLRRTLWAAIRAGRGAAPLLTVRWEDLWGVPIESVRQSLRVPALA